MGGQPRVPPPRLPHGVCGSVTCATPPLSPPRGRGGKSRLEGPRSAGGNWGEGRRKPGNESPGIATPPSQRGAAVSRWFWGGPQGPAPLPEHPSTQRCPELPRSQRSQHPACFPAVYLLSWGFPWAGVWVPRELRGGGQKRCSASGTRLSRSSCSRCSSRGSSSSPSCRFSRVRTLTVPCSRSRRPTTAGARPSGGGQGVPAPPDPARAPPSSEQHPPPCGVQRGSQGCGVEVPEQFWGVQRWSQKGWGGLREALGREGIPKTLLGSSRVDLRAGAGEFPRGTELPGGS